MPDVTLRVDGMSCTGCEQRVTKRLSQVEGVRDADADHEAGTVNVRLVAGREDAKALRDAVEALGYDVTGVDDA
jgi:copper chaperone CopZ